jgi:tetratricopeptide (TPR) repeat protein
MMIMAARPFFRGRSSANLGQCRRFILVRMWQKAPGPWRAVGIVSLVIHLATMGALAFQADAGSPGGTHRPPMPSSQPVAAVPRLQAAEQALLEAAKKNPADFNAQQRLGEFYLQQNRLPEGIQYLEKAQRLNPQDYNSGYDLSLAYLNSAATAKASAQLQRMIAQHETAELDNLLAEVNERSGDIKGAATEYHRAAEVDPSEENIFDLASFLLQHKNYEGFLASAHTFFRYGVEKYPRSAKLMVGLGVTLYAESKYDDAVETLCAAVDLDPADPKPFQFLGKVSRVSPALIPDIRKRLEKFVQLYPNNGPAIYYYAMSLWQRSNAEPAADLDLGKIEVLLKQAIAADPDFYEAHFQLGILYQDQLKYPDAIQEFNQTVRLRPDFNRAHYRLVLLYNRMNQKQLADEHLAILKQLKQEDAEADEADHTPENIQAQQTVETRH